MVPQASLFRFLGYKINAKERKIVFKYSIEFKNTSALSFSETIILPKKTENLNKEYVHKFLEPLSLILGISYYKIYFPPRISISFKLSKEEAQFWNVVYRKGLGEFLYKNKLDPKNLAKFPYSKKQSEPVRINTNDSILLGIGGGKDSIVSLELLKNFQTSLFSIETMRLDNISRNVIKKSGKSSLTLNRMLDSKIFPLQDTYKGHIPISAIYAFLGTLSCFLYGHKYFVVSNEYSSNFGNLKYKGAVINHQWSKSAEFEVLLQEYIKKFITSDITYFSLLRQFHEIRIAKMFANYEKYFHLFASCNRNFNVLGERQKTLWCGECPKCAFVFLMLAPFIERNKLTWIFGKNLLNDPSLLPLYNDILGYGKMKPFDCVGTFEESRVALFLASKKFKQDVVMLALLPKIKNIKQSLGKVFQVFSAPTLPSRFKLLGLEKVGILGYAREGKVTEKYLKKNYPHLKIKILDQARDKNYLEEQMNLEFLIKTSGIPKSKVKIPYTTATNLFFSENKNFTIGVTGSKGKSTTASLIYEILKSAGKKVRLLGNIGNPMLEISFQKPKPDEIFIIELSSYMLEDIEYSPNIAVLLNLFPDHMNYHEGIENYYKAKNNIFKFQKLGDIALRPPFIEKIPMKASEVPLLGGHNLTNVKAAVKTARILGISDEKIRKAILNFKSLPHRLEKVGEFKGIKFYDDAISTTPESTIAAIEALPKTSTIMLGGEDRGYDFTKLEKLLRKKKRSEEHTS